MMTIINKYVIWLPIDLKLYATQSSFLMVYSRQIIAYKHISLSQQIVKTSADTLIMITGMGSDEI